MGTINKVLDNLRKVNESDADSMTNAIKGMVSRLSKSEMDILMNEVDDGVINTDTKIGRKLKNILGYGLGDSVWDTEIHRIIKGN